MFYLACSYKSSSINIGILLSEFNASITGSLSGESESELQSDRSDFLFPYQTLVSELLLEGVFFFDLLEFESVSLLSSKQSISKRLVDDPYVL